jgi:hypothetical protein
MKNLIASLAAAMLLAGCASTSKVEVTHGKAPATVQTASRSEPIYYNGKTYQLDYSFAPALNAFDMKVSGLGAKQKQDAINIATSSLAYYACPDGQRGRLQGTPAYADGKWALQAKCA